VPQASGFSLDLPQRVRHGLKCRKAFAALGPGQNLIITSVQLSKMQGANEETHFKKGAPCRKRISSAAQIIHDAMDFVRSSQSHSARALGFGRGKTRENSLEEFPQIVVPERGVDHETIASIDYEVRAALFVEVIVL
jgi:hypothetical protein